MIGIPDESIETKDTIDSNENDVPINTKDFKEMNPRGKRDITPGIEISKETNKDPPLNVECINNDLGDERKDVTELHTDYEDKTRKCIDRGIEGTLRKLMASFSNTYRFQVISAANIIILSTLFGTVLTKNLEGLRENELIKETSKWKPSNPEDKAYENTLISAFDCLDSSLPSTRISLNPPKQCNIEDGSAYEKAERRRAQVLEHVKLIPVEITTCVVQFRVNVGWCGGEFAIESYMHQDLETLRSQIIPTELDCHQAELDGTIKISTPEYGSIEALDLKLQLHGGKGSVMFQPIGFSRPDSW